MNLAESEGGRKIELLMPIFMSLIAELIKYGPRATVDPDRNLD
jgi:hypothetical protein